jgi:membrane protease YdiL (CAAX protease family)
MAIGYWLIAFSAWYPLSLLAKSLGIPTESSWGWWQWQGLWFLPIALWATGAAFFEEGFFRGYAIPKLTNLLRSPLMALLLSSVAFGLLHGRFGLFLSVYTALFGLIVGTLYLQTRSTWACFAFHLVNNWVVDFIVYGVIVKK